MSHQRGALHRDEPLRLPGGWIEEFDEHGERFFLNEETLTAIEVGENGHLVACVNPSYSNQGAGMADIVGLSRILDEAARIMRAIEGGRWPGKSIDGMSWVFEAEDIGPDGRVTLDGMIPLRVSGITFGIWENMSSEAFIRDAEIGEVVSLVLPLDVATPVMVKAWMRG